MCLATHRCTNGREHIVYIMHMGFWIYLKRIHTVCLYSLEMITNNLRLYV